MKENDRGFVCSWCGAEVDKYKPPAGPADGLIGTCEKDGIVEVEMPDDGPKNKNNA